MRCERRNTYLEKKKKTKIEMYVAVYELKFKNPETCIQNYRHYFAVGC